MKRRYWTPEEVKLLKEKYETTRTSEIAAELGRPLRTVYAKAYAYGLNKCKSLVQEMSRQNYYNNPEKFKVGHFTKGSEPWNKGTKGLTSANKTSFAKGNKPHNTKKVGDISIRQDTTGRFYKYRKIKDAHWELEQRMVWEEHNGAIPEGMVVAFKDNDTMNTSIDNLELLTRDQLMDRNTIHNYPIGIVEAARLTGVLSRLTNKNRKHAQKQD